MALRTLVSISLCALLGFLWKSNVSDWISIDSKSNGGFCAEEEVDQNGDCSWKNKPAPSKCGDEILYMSQTKVKWISRILVYGIHKILVPMNYFGDIFGNFSESPLYFESHHNVRAIKICAKCEDFYSQMDTLEGFENYCGDSYGSNETMTGILFMPSDSAKALIPGSLRTVVWMKALVTTFGPSEILPRNTFGWLYAPFETAFAFLRGGMIATFSKKGNTVMNEVGALMLASRGFVIVAPDYLGYGDDKSLFKGTGIGRVYQTSSLPLWLHTRNLVQEISGGKSKVADECYVAGASEGAAGVLPVAQALHEIGAEVTAYPGAVPSFDLTESIMRRTLTVLRGEWPDSFLGWIAYGGAPFASSNPHYHILRNESFLSEEGENVLVDLVNSDTTFLGMNEHLLGGLKATSECLTSDNDNLTGCPSYLNPVLVQKFRNVVDADPHSNPEFYPCKSKNPAPELSSLCNAIGINNLNHMFASAQYPVKLCHSPSDMVTRFTDVTLKYPNNTLNLELRPTLEQWAEGERRDRKSVV